MAVDAATAHRQLNESVEPDAKKEGVCAAGGLTAEGAGSLSEAIHEEARHDG